jgi:hypothetical protein
MPPECKAIADKYHDLERRIGDKVSQQIKDGLDPMDAPGIEELKKDKSKALQQLHACMEKRRNLRSVLPVTPDPCAGILLELEKLRQGRKFDKDLKEWIDVPASPAQIAALEKELVECRKKNLPPPKSLKSLIESAYP